MRVWFSFIKRFTLLLNTRAHHLPHGSLVLHFRGVSCVHESLSLFTQSTIRVIVFLCNEKHQHIAQRLSDRFSQQSAKQQWPWDFSVSSETIFIINSYHPVLTNQKLQESKGRQGWVLMTFTHRLRSQKLVAPVPPPSAGSPILILILIYLPHQLIPQWIWCRQNSFYDLFINNEQRQNFESLMFLTSGMEKGNLINQFIKA